MRNWAGQTSEYCTSWLWILLALGSQPAESAHRMPDIEGRSWKWPPLVSVIRERINIMGRVDDYVSSLEGKENLDPVVIASTMLELHKTEMGIATSKIDSLNNVISERDAAILAKNSELTATKAENWDLVNRVPVQNDNETPNPANDNGTKPTLEEVLYGKENS